MTTYLNYQNNPAKLAEAFDELTFWASRFGALLFDNLQLRPNLRILDIGCATGFPLFELAQVHGPSSQVTGIDIWQEALPRALTKKRNYEQENVTILGADAAFLPFADTTFDLIVSNLGINNFADPQASLAECYRVASSHARLVLTTNLMGHMVEFYAVYRQTLTDLDLSHLTPQLNAQEARRGTVASVSMLLNQSGFRVTRTVENSFKMRVLNSDALFNHHLIKIGFLDGWRGFLPPEQEQSVFQSLQTALDKLASTKGELTLTIPMLYIEAEKQS
ncbi:MAG: class I SAM-dependent methyltransferase [Chloroflexia bacterium]